MTGALCRWGLKPGRGTLPVWAKARGTAPLIWKQARSCVTTVWVPELCEAMVMWMCPPLEWRGCPRGPETEKMWWYNPWFLWTQAGSWNSFISGLGSCLRDQCLKGPLGLWQEAQLRLAAWRACLEASGTAGISLAATWHRCSRPGTGLMSAGPWGPDAVWVLCHLRSPCDPHCREKNEELWNRESSLYRIYEET